ncbi:hypothetical protein [Spirosoma radiotolerans]|uniref:Outer membrane protein beta-barrel domain-containing protein n=1 Tax=Spirosoma radiotolerans TaxID=1379870 RepID=A0A0E3VAC1_9BACT|nr:hypothetical protein [Spirosoma radiotolerans]AKD57941.1 hypothetical protein SD10_26605 [Spirosoma radiotolerans]
MKKIHFSILLVLGLLAGTQSFAQLAVDKGTKFINVGIGVGGYSSAGGIAFGAAADFGVAPNITVGGQVAYRSFNYGYAGFNDKINYLYFAARGSYHFNEILNLSTDKADLYAGIGLGYESVSYSNSIYGGSTFGSGIFVPIHLGGRYFFSEKVGGFAELGTGIAPLLLGITFKL